MATPFIAALIMVVIAIAIHQAWVYAVVSIWALIWLASLAHLGLNQIAPSARASRRPP